MRFLHYQLRAIFDPEFAIDAVKMNFDRSLADAEVMRATALFRKPFATNAATSDSRSVSIPTCSFASEVWPRMGCRGMGYPGPRHCRPACRNKRPAFAFERCQLRNRAYVTRITIRSILSGGVVESVLARYWVGSARWISRALP